MGGREDEGVTAAHAKCLLRFYFGDGHNAGVTHRARISFPSAGEGCSCAGEGAGGRDSARGRSRAVPSPRSLRGPAPLAGRDPSVPPVRMMFWSRRQLFGSPAQVRDSPLCVR